MKGWTLKRNNRVTREKDVLSWRPADGRVANGDPRGVMGQRRQLCLAGPQAIASALWMEDRYISVEHEAESNEPVEEEQPDRDPDPHMNLLGRVDVYHADEGSE